MASQRGPWLSCEDEQLHRSGAIQSFGVLLAVEPRPPHRVLCASENVEAVLGMSLDQLLGGSFDALGWLDPALLDEVGPEPGAEAELSVRGHEHLDWAQVVRTRELLLIELEPRPSRHNDAPHRGWSSVESNKSHAELARRIRHLVGFERVMVYRFHGDWSGEVVAESLEPGARHASSASASAGPVQTYLGLRFPASDIPAIARAIYLANPYRVIPDVEAAAVSIRSVDGSFMGPPDLTRSRLRSVSPLHIEYLQNMGVRSSLSIPLVVGGELWGLVACHHFSPRLPSLMARRRAVEVVRAHAIDIAFRRAELGMMHIEKRDRELEHVAKSIREESDLLDALASNAERLRTWFEASGFVASVGDQRVQSGQVPSESELDHLDQAFGEALGPIWQTECLSGNASWGQPLAGVKPSVAAGLLGVDVSGRSGPPTRLYWFRAAEPYEVNWAGNPDKPADLPQLSPRRSFEAWVELRTRYCRPWEPAVRTAAEGVRTALLRAQLEGLR